MLILKTTQTYIHKFCIIIYTQITQITQMSTSTTKSIPTWGEVTGKMPTVYKETRTGYFQSGQMYVTNCTYNAPSTIVWACTSGDIKTACDIICWPSKGEYGFIKLNLTINNSTAQVFVMSTTIMDNGAGTYSLIGKFDYQTMLGGTTRLDLSIDANAVLFS